MENGNFQPPKPQIPYEVLVVIIVGLFCLLLMLIACCMMQCHKNRRRLWSNTQVNPSQPVLPPAHPMSQEDVSTSADNNDIPPDYTVVVEQKTMATNTGNSLNRYPKVAGGKKMETPPPAYTTVGFFQ